ncbi:mid1-interacting protein 1-B-like isoform X2 [Narcine bancroftii]|uniref:mid1-interacting protein 1-B-like isoform X2 n=1 Tax=Narcine bancroftii TaxID=1343680 RepID=UPI003831AC95
MIFTSIVIKVFEMIVNFRRMKDHSPIHGRHPFQGQPILDPPHQRLHFLRRARLSATIRTMFYGRTTKSVLPGSIMVCYGSCKASDRRLEMYFPNQENCRLRSSQIHCCKLCKMMQFSELKNNQHSLFSALNKFVTAATIMDETIMVPSLLWDLPEEGEHQRVNRVSKQRDLYDNYLLLLSMRTDIEFGIQDEQVKSSLEPEKLGDDDNLGDLQQLFHHHLNGLFNILSKLTMHANSLTSRYTRELFTDLGR